MQKNGAGMAAMEKSLAGLKKNKPMKAPKVGGKQFSPKKGM